MGICCPSWSAQSKTSTRGCAVQIDLTEQQIHAMLAALNIAVRAEGMAVARMCVELSDVLQTALQSNQPINEA